MFKPLFAALLSAALFAAIPLGPLAAQTAAKPATETKDAATAKPPKQLTAQQQKMKDCAAKWQIEKKEKKVNGATAYRKFLSGCLKG